MKQIQWAISFIYFFLYFFLCMFLIKAMNFGSITEDHVVGFLVFQLLLLVCEENLEMDLE